ncbi:MAG: UDP-N-acetylmuramate dehydrogenase [Methylococcaceae bacterium]|nr:UDP-N-acetylmuramate dehydrogenase [Methylococcaceae bacterium]
MAAVLNTQNTNRIGPPLRGDLRYNEPLASYTSWRVGGPADRLYLPADAEDLMAFLNSLPDSEPLFWLGLGSNLLVRDGGIRGTVICTKNRLKQIRLLDDGRVYAEAGVPSAQVAKFCSTQRLAGAEFLAGIPGTLGGALAMNAGAFGGETWPLVERVLTVDRHGQHRHRSADEFKVGYRTVVGRDGEWFVAAELRLHPGEPDISRSRMKALLATRAEKQPIQQPSCGSVFRNPPGDFAARLIELCGLKGHSIGGAQVSEKHANFIVNTGGAKAAEIEALIGLVRECVARKQGVTLEPECRIVGEGA